MLVASFRNVLCLCNQLNQVDPSNSKGTDDPNTSTNTFSQEMLEEGALQQDEGGAGLEGPPTAHCSLEGWLPPGTGILAHFSRSLSSVLKNVGHITVSGIPTAGQLLFWEILR